MNKKIVIITAAILLTACAEEVQLQKTVQKVPLHIEAISQAAITRTSTGIQSTLFDANEDVNAYFTVRVDGDASALISEKDNTLSTAGNPVILKTAAASNGVNALSPKDGSTLYFPPGDNDKVDVSIYALYPSTVTSSLTSFAVQTPQTTDADYKASDLMYASATSPKTDQAIHLQFNHKMAKLIINASGEEGLTMKKITLKSLYTTIGWNATTGVLGSTSGSTSDIEIASNESFTSSLTGVALFPPQTKSDTYFMEVTCQDPTDNNAEKTAYFKICTKEFEEGKVYTINVKIGPRNLKDDGIVLIEPWPSTVGVVNIEAVGNMGLAITSLTDDGNNDTNTMSGSKFSKDKEDGDSDDVLYHFTYNGKSCTPVPTVTDGKDKNPTTLVAGTDYEVKYYNNLNAGTALVVVTGKGDYDGFSTFETFTINRAANTMSYPNNNAAFSTNLSKNAIVQNALVKPSLQTNEVYGHMTYGLYSDAACTNAYTGDIATIDANGNVNMQKKGGPVYVKASMDDTGNFEAKTVSYALTITAGDASSVMEVTLTNGDSYTYTGSEIQPVFVVRDNGNTLAYGTDYTYTYGTGDNQKNVCTAADKKAYIKITGINEYSGDKYVYFNITQATTVITVLKAQKILSYTKGNNYAGTMIDQTTLAFTDAFSTNFGTLTYQSGNTSYVTVTDGAIKGVAKSSGYVTVTANVAATTNWTAATATMQVKVEEMYKYIAYSGAMTSFELPNTKTATVYAELIGGAGGNDGTDAQQGVGGYGGLVKAHRNYSSGTAVTLYICVGGGGIHATGEGAGWNGGGLPGLSGASGGGGGATDISTTGVAYDNATHISNRVLVAGGGGGSSNVGGGGTSGAPIGTDEVGDYTGNWRGEDNTVGTIDGGGGGAGYVGGVKGIEDNSSGKIVGGHGGSNYIASTWVSDTNGTSTNGGWHGTGANLGYTGEGQHGWAIIWYTYADN